VLDDRQARLQGLHLEQPGKLAKAGTVE